MTSLSNQSPDISDKTSSTESEALVQTRESLPDDEVLYDLAELFKVFGDTTRVKILYALFENELWLNDMPQCVNTTPSAVSHQLRILKSSKLVRFRREGKTVFYALDDDHVRSMITLGLDHIAE